jgi:hypothetical protein
MVMQEGASFYGMCAVGPDAAQSRPKPSPPAPQPQEGKDDGKK